ncbi:hypothetical protein BC628DRAFT_1028773 [Trametes gibbosa]|nr:hypothetical protein BC628DRAFT_1028773 [Trametes gibbosa]
MKAISDRHHEMMHPNTIPAVSTAASSQDAPSAVSSFHPTVDVYINIPSIHSTRTDLASYPLPLFDSIEVDHQHQFASPLREVDPTAFFKSRSPSPFLPSTRA